MVSVQLREFVENFIEEAVIAKSGPVKVNSHAQMHMHTF